jgi:hypothetical protein
MVSSVLALGMSACSGTGSTSLLPEQQGTGLPVQSELNTSTPTSTSSLSTPDRAAASLTTNSALEPSALGQTLLQANTVSIDAGGSATAAWIADAYYSGGNVARTTGSIDTHKVSNPASQAVYQSNRWGRTLAYQVPGLTPGASYGVRLHFAETFWNAAKCRVFDVSINGTRVLTNFDIFKAAGGKNTALVMPFTSTADPHGKISIVFSATVNNALISGIEIGKAIGASPPPTEFGTPEMPRSADQFVDSVGINTHFRYGSLPYGASFGQVSSDLLALHVRHIRDSAVNSDSGLAYYQRLASLAGSGIHSDIISDLNQSASSISNTISLSGRSVESVEYPNEYDNNGDKTWITDIQSYGKSLYSEKARFANLPVIGPSFVYVNSYSQTFPQGAFASSADYGNVHDYFWTYNPDNPGWGSTVANCGTWATVSFWKGCAQYIEPHKVMSTETGWDDGATYGKRAGSISAAVKARYEMRALLAHWNAGFVKTYLYSLIDTGNENFGLMTGSLLLKPSYRAVQTLLADLTDSGGAPALTPLTYNLSATSSVYHTLLQKRDGSYHLLIWNGVLATDPVIPTKPVTLTFAKTFSSVTKHVWQDDGTMVTTPLTPSAVISLSVTDRVTELVLK